MTSIKEPIRDVSEFYHSLIRITTKSEFKDLLTRYGLQYSKERVVFYYNMFSDSGSSLITSKIYFHHIDGAIATLSLMAIVAGIIFGMKFIDMRFIIFNLIVLVTFRLLCSIFIWVWYYISAKKTFLKQKEALFDLFTTLIVTESWDDPQSCNRDDNRDFYVSLLKIPPTPSALSEFLVHRNLQCTQERIVDLRKYLDDLFLRKRMYYKNFNVILEFIIIFTCALIIRPDDIQTYAWFLAVYGIGVFLYMHIIDVIEFRKEQKYKRLLTLLDDLSIMK